MQLPPHMKLRCRSPIWADLHLRTRLNGKRVGRKKKQRKRAQNGKRSGMSFIFKTKSLCRILRNRLHTGHGRCNNALHKWGLLSSPNCNCSLVSQTINHIIENCSLRRFDTFKGKDFQVTNKTK